MTRNEGGSELLQVEILTFFARTSSQVGLLLLQKLERLKNGFSSNNFFRTILELTKVRASFSHWNAPLPRSSSDHISSQLNKTREIRMSYMVVESLIFKLRKGDMNGAKFTLEEYV